MNELTDMSVFAEEKHWFGEKPYYTMLFYYDSNLIANAKNM